MLRNKLIFFIVAFVCVLSFASCNNNTEETSYNGEKSLSLVEETSYESEFFFSSPKYKATVQSLSENTHQYAMGEIAIDHGDIYYINGSGAGIEKISEDGKIHEWVVKDFVDSFFISGEWLFYVDRGYALNRMKKDGSEICDENIGCFHAVLDNGWLYFTAEGRAGVNLFRVKLNGDRYSEVISESIYPNFIIEDSKIYYKLSEGPLRSCSLVGDNISEIGKMNAGKFVVSNNSIFYINKDDGNCLYKSNGNKNQKVSSMAVKDFGVTDYNIYYTQAEESNKNNDDFFIESYNLHYMEKADNIPKKITDGRVTNIQVIEDSVYFRINWQLYHLENDNKTFKRVVANGDCSESINEIATKTFALSSAGNFNNGGNIAITENTVLLSYHDGETDTLIQIQNDSKQEQTISSGLHFYDVLVQVEDVYYKIKY